MTRACNKCGTSIEHLPKTRVCCSQFCADRVSKNKRHGLSDTIEHRAWARIRRRCNSPTYHNYPRYGARGIKVCERWDIFENFLADMGPRPAPGYSVERINNDGNYEPSNCKWATQKEQNNNKCNVSTPEQDRKIKEGLENGYSFDKIADLIGKTPGSVKARVYRIGLSMRQSKTHPSQKQE